jgi:hypothetical protein
MYKFAPFFIFYFSLAQKGPYMDVSTLVGDPASCGVPLIPLQPCVGQSTDTPSGTVGLAGVKLEAPAAVATTPAGAVFVVDATGHRLRLIMSSVAYTVAGSSGSGFADGVQAAAKFTAPRGVAVSPADASIVYVADTGNHRLRRVTVDYTDANRAGTVTTLAGSGVAMWADGTAAAAAFFSPAGLAASGGYVYVADFANHRVRTVDVATGYVSTLAGNGVAMSAEGVGAAASFYYPSALAVAGAGPVFPIGMLFVVEEFAAKLRQLSNFTKATQCVAGCVAGSGDFLLPRGVAVGADHTLFVADAGANVVRRVWPAPAWDGRVSTVAGVGGLGNFGDGGGQGASAAFSGPAGLALDAADGTGGTLLVADEYNAAVRVLKTITTPSPFPSPSTRASLSGFTSASHSPSASRLPTGSPCGTASASPSGSGSPSPCASRSLSGSASVSRDPSSSTSASGNYTPSRSSSGTPKFTTSPSGGASNLGSVSVSGCASVSGSRSVAPSSSSTSTASASGGSLSGSTCVSASRSPSGTVSGRASGTAPRSGSLTASLSATSRLSVTPSGTTSPSGSPSPSALGTPSNIPFNHAPDVALAGAGGAPNAAYALEFKEAAGGAGALLLAPNLTLSDVEGHSLLRASWRLHGCVAGDRLNATAPLPAGLVAAPFSSASPLCELVLFEAGVGEAEKRPLTLEVWQAALRGVAFSSAAWGVAGSSATRNVTLEVVDTSGTDADGHVLLLGPQTTAATFPLRYVRYNNAPTLALAGLAGDAAGAVAGALTPGWTAAANYTLLAPALAVADAEGALAAANVTLGNGACAPGLQLRLGALPVGGASENVTLRAGDGCLLLLVGAAPPAVFARLLRTAYFQSAAVNPKAVPNVSVRVCVTDAAPAGAANGAASACLALTLLTGPNEPPVLLVVPPELQMSELTNALDGAAAEALRAPLLAGDWDPLDAPLLRVLVAGLAPAGAGAAAASALFNFSPLSAPPPGALADAIPATAFSLNVAPGWLLANQSAKSFLLSVAAAESTALRGSAALRSTAAPVQVTVRRPNRAVTFSPVPVPLLPLSAPEWGVGALAVAPPPTPAYFGQIVGGVLPVNLNENAPPGTSVGPVLAAYDADVIQSLRYTLMACVANGAGSAQAICPEGLFSLSHGPFALVVDPWGSGAVWNVTRNATLSVALDALDYEWEPLQSLNLTIRVEDDAAQHSPALPRELPTSADLTIHVTLVNDPGDDAPKITEVEGFPQGGVSTAGGDAVLLRGEGLGLPGGPSGAAVRGEYADAACVRGDWRKCTIYAAAGNCTVTVRHAEVRCVTAPGFGGALAWRLFVGGSGALARATNWSTATMAYRAPVLRSVMLASAAMAAAWPLPALGAPIDSTQGGTFLLLTGEGFPAAAATPSDGSASYALAVRYGPTGIEYGAPCVVAANFSALLCRTAAGAGAGLRWSVTVGDQTYVQPTLSYDAPSITSVEPTLLSTVGGERVLLRGANFGPLGAADAGSAAGLNWVRYSVPGGASAPVFEALNCSVVASGVACVSVPGWGWGLAWQVSVAGVASAPFSGGGGFAYFPPRLQSLTPLSAASLLNPGAPSNATAVVAAAFGALTALPLALSTAGKELLDVRGFNFSVQGAATVQLLNGSFFNGSLLRGAPTVPVLYVGHNRLVATSVPGIGKFKWLAVTVAGNTTRLPFSYAPPSIDAAGLMLQQPDGSLQLRVTGANFGACCFCAKLPSRCNAAVCAARSAEDVAACEAGATQCDSAQPTFRVEFIFDASDPAVDVCDVISITDTTLVFRAKNKARANITVTVGGQTSAMFNFDLQSALSSNPKLKDGQIACGPIVLIDDGNKFSADISKMQPCATKGGESMEILGSNLQSLGNVYFELPGAGDPANPAVSAGAVVCPPVFSTALMKAGAPWSSQQPSTCPTECCSDKFGNDLFSVSYADLKRQASDSVLSNTFTRGWYGVQAFARAEYFVSANGTLTPLFTILLNGQKQQLDELALAALVDRTAVYDPLYKLPYFNTTVPAWVQRPLLCHVTHWYMDDSFANLCGSATVITPPGVGSLRVYTNSYTSDSNTTNFAAAVYKRATNVALWPRLAGAPINAGTGSTAGDVVEVFLTNGPPAEFLFDVWAPFLRDARTPGNLGAYTPRAVTRSGAPNFALAFSYSNMRKFKLEDTLCASPVLAWNSSYIRCRAPEGVSFALMYLFLYDMSPMVPTALQEEELTYQYARGSLLYLPPQMQPPVVGERTIRRVWGASLGASLATDNSGFRVAVEALPGEGGGTVRGSVVVVAHNHTYIDVQLPAGMGQVLLKFFLAMPFGVVDSRQPVMFRYAAVNFTGAPDSLPYAYQPPRVRSVATTGVARNPCVGLNADGTRDDVPSPMRAYYGDGSAGITCFRASNIEVSDRVTPFAPAALIFRGENFGFTSAQPSVSIGGVACTVTNLVDPVPAADPAFVTSVQELSCVMKNLIYTGRGVPVLFESALAPPASVIFDVALDAVCDEGMYAPAPGMPCLVCPAGGVCSGGFFQPLSQAGFWPFNASNWQAAGLGKLAESALPTFVACPPPAEACRGGIDAAAAAAAAAASCRPGHKGFLCAQCEKDWGRTTGDFCAPCVGTQGAAFVLAGTALAFAVLFFLQIRRAMADDRGLDLMVSKMFINHLQMVAALRGYVENSKVESILLSWLWENSSRAGLDPQSSSLDCFGVDYFTKLLGMMVSPVILVLLPPVVMLLYKGVATLVLRKRWTGLQEVGSISKTAAVVILFFIQNSLVNATQLFFQSAPPERGGFLRVDPSVNIGSDQYNSYKLGMYFCSALYIVAVPLTGMFVVLSLSSKELLQHKDTLRYWGFLYFGFDQKESDLSGSCCGRKVRLPKLRLRILWEPLVMIRKSLFVMIGVWITVFEFQVYVALALILVTLFTLTYVQPYVTSHLTYLEAESLLAVALLYVAVLVINLGAPTSDYPVPRVGSQPIFVFSVLVAAYNAYVIVRFVILWCRSKLASTLANRRKAAAAASRASVLGTFLLHKQGGGQRLEGMDVDSGAADGGGAQQEAPYLTATYRRGKVELLTRTRQALSQAQEVGLRRSALRTVAQEDGELLEQHAGALLGVNWEKRWTAAHWGASGGGGDGGGGDALAQLEPPPPPAAAADPAPQPPPLAVPPDAGGAAAHDDAATEEPEPSVRAVSNEFDAHMKKGIIGELAQLPALAWLAPAPAPPSAAAPRTFTVNPLARQGSLASGVGMGIGAGAGAAGRALLAYRTQEARGPVGRARASLQVRTPAAP